MEKHPKHRPHRANPNNQRKLVESDLKNCPLCGSPLKPRRTWHTQKTIQTLQGSVFVAGKSKECPNGNCGNYGKHYYASHVGMFSLPHSTYGLDVLALIGWEHEHNHRQLVEIQGELNRRGVEINERNTGKLYRQFLGLLSASSQNAQAGLAATAEKYGGVIWAVDALQPEGQLYVLYEVLSGQPIAVLQGEQIGEEELNVWLKPYQGLPFRVLATLSDGEATLVAALKGCWPQAPHQRCQTHFLNNLAEAVLGYDDELRKNMRQDLGGLPKVPQVSVDEPENNLSGPPLCKLALPPRSRIGRDRKLAPAGDSRCCQPQ
jgi:hypothetical protein